MRIDALQRRVIMDAEVLHTALKDILPTKMPVVYQHRHMNMASFVKRLNAATTDLNIHHTIAPDTRLGRNEIRISGEWLPDNLLPEDNSDADVRIRWHIYPHTRRRSMTPYLWKRWRVSYWSYVLHEFVHRAQGALRADGNTLVFKPEAADPEIHNEQKYLGDFDEIEAYAYEVALEMLCWYADQPFRDAFQQMQQEHTNPSSATYPIYSKTFADNPQHPAVQAFHRKIKAWHKSMLVNRDFYDSLELH
jgi:hypothetical protein